MTSSLVGSEMCIRDRLTRSGQEWRLGPHVASTVQDLGVDVQSHHRFFPVSYTHLTLPTICSV
eukprot:1989487-Prorocentrum_lima.AAC.1